MLCVFSGPCRGQERVVDALKIGLQAVVAVGTRFHM